MNRRPTGRTAFTLVELLVVIAIIGVLVALLLPAIQAAREAARRAQCQNNLKQLGLGILNYDSAKGKFPPGSTCASAAIQDTYLTTWTVDILPFMEQMPLYTIWNPKADSSDATNKKLRETLLPSHTCPSDVEMTELLAPDSGDKAIAANALYAPGSYRGVSGARGTGTTGDQFWDNPNAAKTTSFPATDPNAFPEWTRGPLHAICKTVGAGERQLTPISTKSITDGTSNTLLVGEYHTTTTPAGSAKSRRTMWAYAYTSYNQSSGIKESRTLIPDFAKCETLPGADHTCKRAWGSLHTSNVIQFVRCDGSFVGISPEIDTTLFAAFCTVQGEESAPPLP